MENKAKCFRVFSMPGVYLWGHKTKTMIVVTGAAGFIGSALVSRLNSQRFFDVVVVDDFSRPDKNANLEGKIVKTRVRAQTPQNLTLKFLTGSI